MTNPSEPSTPDSPVTHADNAERAAPRYVWVMWSMLGIMIALLALVVIAAFTIDPKSPPGRAIDLVTTVALVLAVLTMIVTHRVPAVRRALSVPATTRDERDDAVDSQAWRTTGLVTGLTLVLLMLGGRLYGDSLEPYITAQPSVYVTLLALQQLVYYFADLWHRHILQDLWARIRSR